MSDQQDPRKEQYERARDAFEALDIEDRTLFLVRETVNTIAAGVDTFARQLAKDLDAAFHPPEEAGDEAPEAAPDADEPPKAKKTTKAKSSAKKNASKTSAKKKATKTSGGKKAKGNQEANPADESDDDA